ncbi:tetratricopeptide repeat protein [Nonomuraea ferruginea]
MALRHLGAVRQSAGRHDDAASAYRRALALDPADLRAATRLADALVAAGRLPEARALLSAHSPHDAALHLARSLRTHGHLTEAITTLQAARARGAQPDTPLGAASGEVGTALGGEDPAPGEHAAAGEVGSPLDAPSLEVRTAVGGENPAPGEHAAAGEVGSPQGGVDAASGEGRTVLGGEYPTPRRAEGGLISRCGGCSVPGGEHCSRG